MSQSKPISKKQRFLRFIQAHSLSALTIIAVSFVTHLFIEEYLSEEWGKGTKLLAAVCVGFAFERILHSRYDQKRRVDKFMQEFHSSMGMAAPVVESLNEISSQPYSKALERHFVDQNLPRQVSALFAEWQRRIALRHKWRLIFERHLNSEVAAVTENSLSLPLETYLQILLEFISVSMEEATESNRKLVIRSFTNARPKDWFDKSGAPSAAASMEDYRTSLQQLVARMHQGQHTYRRHVLCSSTLSGFGFADARTVENGWLQLTENERGRYYSVHSEGKEGAFYFDLDDNIAFCENHTEYIYFGYKKGNDLSWEWCFCCLYTNNNLNVSASFIDMTSEADYKKWVIDSPNNKGLDLKSGFAVPQRLQVSFQEFPDVIDGDLIGKAKPFRSVAPLATKWHRASLIWHDEKEARVLSEYFKGNLKAGATILDCACGTGFHPLLLSQLGFAVTASDIDPDNIAILRDQPDYQAKPFPLQVADWKRLHSSVSGTFDCVLCLGSSITYYDSWQEDAEIKMYEIEELEAIVQEMKRMLNPDGKLIIGISRYYDRRFDSFDCTFAQHAIQGVIHSMKWSLSYDWDKRRKTWLCEIRNEHDEDYSFRLSSYLFNAYDLEAVCQRVFGDGNVTIVDVDSSYYDTLVIGHNS